MPSEVFFSLVLSTASGLLIALCTGLYRSKCSHIKCCGLEIERDIKSELDIEEHQMDLSKNNKTETI